MATEAQHDVRPRKPKTLVGRLLALLVRIAAALLFAMVTSIIVEWIGITVGWWPADHSANNLATEVGWIDTAFTRSLLFSDPAQTAAYALTLVYDTVFVATGIAPWLSAHSGAGTWLGLVAIYVQAAVNVSLVVLVRAVILVLTSPLFAMAALVGIVDGLVRRDLRRYGAGREMALVYHNAKRLVAPVFITGWVFYIGMPWSVHPNVFLLPCAALFGLLLSITVGTFKKYL